MLLRLLLQHPDLLSQHEDLQLLLVDFVVELVNFHFELLVLGLQLFILGCELLVVLLPRDFLLFVCRTRLLGKLAAGAVGRLVPAAQPTTRLNGSPMVDVGLLACGRNVGSA